MYTFFLYLSDVEEGGGTKFDLGFTVQPKKGKAVIWPATHNERPFVQDPRTHHEALPVTKGTKYAANFWIHNHAFRSRMGTCGDVAYLENWEADYWDYPAGGAS